jgi:hypothetical protein
MVGLTGPLLGELLGMAIQAQGQVALDQRTTLVIEDFVRRHAP